MKPFPYSSIRAIRRKRTVLRPWVIKGLEYGVAIAVGFAIPYAFAFAVEVLR